MTALEQHAPAARKERRALSRRRLGMPLGIFGVILGLYVAITAAILMSDGLALVALVPLSGVLVVMLFVIGHDACHQSFTSSRRLNGWIGRIAFLPTLHAFSLWDREHNRRHHRFNNIRGLDYAWVPWSPHEFARARFLARLKYRFYRDPGGVLFNYLFEIWAQRNIVPRRAMLGEIAVEHVLDALIVWGFFLFYLAALAHVGASFGQSPLASIVLGFVLPFLIFSMLISAAIYMHHTHYDVAWYSDVAEWKRENGALFGTVHVRFPWIVRKVILHIMEHPAHHVAPSMPLYRLDRAEETVERPGVVAWDFSFKEYFQVCARCKLFDYEKGIWTDFKGNPTSGPLLGLRVAA